MEPIQNNMTHPSTGGLKSIFPYDQIQDHINQILQKPFFFIIGAPKSGTTWLQNLLNGHPNILCSGEMNFSHLSRILKNSLNEYNQNIFNLNEQHIKQETEYLRFSGENLTFILINTIALLFSNWIQESGERRLGAKNPDIIFNIDFFSSLLPSAKFIHIIRDGRDVITSGWHHNHRMNTTTVKKYPELHQYVEFCVKDWASAISNGKRFMANNGDRCIDLRYEELHKDPFPVIRRTLSFLQVDISDEMIQKCILSGDFKKLSGGRVRGQEDPNHFFRKGVVGDWQNLFDDKSLDVFLKYGGDLLEELGYQ